MSGTVTLPAGASASAGYPVSSAPAGQQAQDTDGLLALQIDPTQATPTQTLRRLDPRTLTSSYVPAKAVLLGAGPGASRGLEGAAVPAAGDPMLGYAIDATLQVVEPAAGAPAGTLPVLRVASGVAGGIVGLDAQSNAQVPGGTLTLGAPATAGGPVVALSRDAAGHILLLGTLPDVEDGFVPTPGSRVLYLDGGALKVAL